MDKRQLTNALGKLFTTYAESNDLTVLIDTVTEVIGLLEGLKYDERQAKGVSLLIAHAKNALVTGAITKAQSPDNYKAFEKMNVAMVVSYVIPNIIEMAIFE